MPSFKVKYKRKVDRTIYRSIYAARKKAYSVCLKGGWGTECIVYRMVDDKSKCDIGRATAKGGNEISWTFYGQEKYKLREDGTIIRRV